MLFKPKNQQLEKWWILIAATTSISIVFIDQTAVAVALPQLHIDFNLSDIMQQWILNSYLLTLAVLTVLGGRISDIIGKRRAFLIGLCGFMVASWISGAACNAFVLIFGRVLQGMFGAILIPNTSVAIFSAFPPKQKGTAMGIYIGAASIFLTLGPLIGGFFTQFLSWRLIFLINIPLGILSFLFAFYNMPKFKHVKGEKIDWPGFIVSSIATTAFITAIMEGASWGWFSLPIISLFIIFGVSISLFFFLEQKVKIPLIDLQLLHDKNYLLCLALRFGTQICVMIRVFWALFFQLALGVSAFTAGLMLLPSTIPVMIATPFAGKLVDRLGNNIPIIGGIILTTIGLGWVTIFATTFNYWHFVFGMILVGIGLPVSGMPLFIKALESIDPAKHGIASGVFNQIRQIGSSIGIALVGAIITNLDTHFFTKLTSNKFAFIVKKISIDSLLTNSDAAKKIFASLTKTTATEVHYFAKLAYATAFYYGMIVVTMISLISLLLITLNYKKKIS